MKLAEDGKVPCMPDAGGGPFVEHREWRRLRCIKRHWSLWRNHTGGPKGYTAIDLGSQAILGMPFTKKSFRHNSRRSNLDV
jgi:hypothetical protein